MTPQRLATPLQSLPPILHVTYPKPMLSYSKGSRGLFVPQRVIGIFTDTSISPSSWLRQRRSEERRVGKDCRRQGATQHGEASNRVQSDSTRSEKRSSASRRRRRITDSS